MNLAPTQYMGGKVKIAAWIVRHLPKHRTYVEVFGGSGAVLFNKIRAEIEVYNDLWKPIATLMKVLRDRPNEYLEWLHKNDPTTSFKEFLSIYQTCKELVKDSLTREVDEVSLAGSAYIALHYCINAEPTGFGWHKSSKFWMLRSDVFSRLRIPQWSKRLKDVVIENLDYREVILKYDASDTVFYCDPPYLSDTIGHDTYYSAPFGYYDHYELAEMLNNIQGKAIVSYYPHQRIVKFYPDWRRSTKNVKRASALETIKENGTHPRAIEWLLMNYRPRLVEAFQ